MKVHLLLFISCLFVLASTTSCKKGREIKKNDGKDADDIRSVTGALDEAIEDANQLSGGSSIGGRYSGTFSLAEVPCGAIADTSQVLSGVLKLTYSGSVCNGKRKSGTVIISLPGFADTVRWKQAGAILKIEYQQFKISNESGSSSVLLNGFTETTNINGGLIRDLLPNTNGINTVIHESKGTSISATFQDGSIGVYNISRRITYSFINQTYRIVSEGTGAYNGLEDLDIWGTTRAGKSFTNQVIENQESKSPCGWWRPTKGKSSLLVDLGEEDLEAITQMGVDSEGNEVNSGCSWGFRISWTYKGKEYQRLYPYW